LDADGLKRMRGITKLRFLRLTRQEEVIEVLTDALGKNGITATDSGPYTEGISLRNADGTVDMVLFGRTARLFEYFSKQTKLSPQQLMSKSLRLAGKNLDNPDWPLDAKEWILNDELEKEREAADQEVEFLLQRRIPPPFDCRPRVIHWPYFDSPHAFNDVTILKFHFHDHPFIGMSTYILWVK
jgi:hypothetical protein